MNDAGPLYDRNDMGIAEIFDEPLADDAAFLKTIEIVVMELDTGGQLVDLAEREGRAGDGPLITQAAS